MFRGAEASGSAKGRAAADFIAIDRYAESAVAENGLRRFQCNRSRSFLISSRRSSAYSSMFRKASSMRHGLRFGSGAGFGRGGGLSAGVIMGRMVARR